MTPVQTKLTKDETDIEKTKENCRNMSPVSSTFHAESTVIMNIQF